MAKKIFLPHKMIRNQTDFVKHVNTKVTSTPTKYGLPKRSSPIINTTVKDAGQSISEALKEKLKASAAKMRDMSANTGINGGSTGAPVVENNPEEKKDEPTFSKFNFNWKIAVPVMVVIIIVGYFIFKNK